MPVDLTVAAIPGFFGSMEAERRWLDRRAELEGPTAYEYTKPDALASLSMGVGSLVLPLATNALARYVVPGEGKFPRVLMRTAVVGAIVTSVADRLGKEAPENVDASPDCASGRSSGGVARTELRKVTRWARKVSAIGGVTTMAAAGLAAATKVSAVARPKRMWRKGQERDLGGGVVAASAAIIGWDFIYYWNHRMMHEVRWSWAHHVVHHSSERYNLSTALRQPVAETFGLFIPYGLLCRLGVRPALVEQARGVNLLYQYWIHTDAIDRLARWFEDTFNTPSHHRVHHGANPQYIDRNHGSILIIWDRLFGTFEREDEPVRFGLTKNVDSYNPLRIATHEWADMLCDVAGSRNWRDRFSFVLRGPGWAYARHAEDAAARATPTRPPSAPVAA